MKCRTGIPSLVLLHAIHLSFRHLSLKKNNEKNENAFNVKSFFSLFISESDTDYYTALYIRYTARSRSYRRYAKNISN